MLSIIKQTAQFYLKNKKLPQVSELKIEDESLLHKKGSLFITFYEKGEVRGSAGNITDLRDTIVDELIENTVEALVHDSRFSPITIEDVSKLKIRLDIITKKDMITEIDIKKLDPVTSWILVLKKDYEKLAAILPNINPKLLTGSDFIPVLQAKLWVKEFDAKDYIIYALETKIYRDF